MKNLRFFSMSMILALPVYRKLCYQPIVGLNYKFYGTSPIFNNIGRSKGGSAIIVKSNISHNIVGLQTALQAIAVRVVLCKQLTICSLYLEPISNPTYIFFVEKKISNTL